MVRTLMVRTFMVDLEWLEPKSQQRHFDYIVSFQGSGIKSNPSFTYASG